MAIIAIEYIYDVKKLNILAEHRPAHREFLRSLFDEGTLLASGPLGSSHALILLKAETPQDALNLLNSDPLQAVEVIENRIAKIWNPVIGPWNEEKSHANTQ